MLTPQERACCFTGSRKVENPFAILAKLMPELDRLTALGVTDFYCGAAVGFDLIAARAVIGLRRECPGIRLICALPCRDQARFWGAPETRAYEAIVQMADETRLVSERYFSGCMQKRNRYMVDRSRFCIAYMPRQNGGTFYTVSYAQRRGLEIIHLTPQPQSPQLTLW